LGGIKASGDISTAKSPRTDAKLPYVDAKSTCIDVTAELDLDGVTKGKVKGKGDAEAAKKGFFILKKQKRMM
jgi:hypothetical protein